MIGRLSAFLSLIFVGLGAEAQVPDCVDSEPACVLDAAWSAALILPEEKRDRLAPAFLEMASFSGDPELLSVWETRFGRRFEPAEPYPDYGWQKAEPILAQNGVDGLISIAQRRQAPLSFGRVDALLSAGKRLRLEQPKAAEKLNRALIDFARASSKFEKPVLANAAAELAMERCDRGLLSEAVALTDAPNNLRYAFWRARLQGSRGDLLSRVRAIDNDEDTREVRRVLDGYRAILEFGYCDQTAPAIGG